MTPRPRKVTSRRERPAKPALTRDGIIAAAVAILSAEGLEKVTMRRIAQELDTGPASLYVYVANTADLRAAVLDELLGEVSLDAAGDGDWRERLTGVLVSYTAVLMDYPTLARSAVTARPSGQHYLRLIERLLALLDEGGVPPQQAAWGADVLLQVATASAAEHSASDRPPAESAAAWDAAARALREAPEATHPHVRALAGNLLAGSPEERQSWGLRMLINGIVSTPAPAELNDL
jgi:AcrR family transcriptional regulator